MIEIPEDITSRINYLINQALRGHHLIFPAFLLKKALDDGAATRHICEEDAYQVEPHLERLLLEADPQKREVYLSGLDRVTLDRLVRTYFQMINNRLDESQETRH